MRKKNDDQNDGILVAVGNHFNYVLGRQWNGREKAYCDASNLVELVDSAIDDSDRDTAISHLTLDGGHGTISSGWKVDCSIQPWNHGTRVFQIIGGGGTTIRVMGDGTDYFSWNVVIGDTSWEICECSVDSAKELENLLSRTEKNCNQSRL